MDSVKLAMIAGALAAAFGTGWAVNGWRLGDKVSKLEATHATTVADSMREGLREFSRVVAERDAKQAQLNRIAADGLAAIAKAKNETDRLRRCLADGTCGLRIRATCPPPAPDVPGAPGGGGVATAPAPFLDPAAGPDYLALRENITLTEATLATCQKALGAFGGVSATTPAGQSPAP
jgi:prophage endopeptidase